MGLSSSEIKRQILLSAGTSDIKKKFQHNLPGISEGEQIEMGNDLESLTKTKGWTWVEAFMLRRMDIVGLVFSDKENPDQKGVAKGYMELMQYIQIAIQNKDAILEKEKIKHEAKNVSEDEGKST